MKRIWQHPPELPTGKTYWRSLDELADQPEFKNWLEKEFPSGLDVQMNGMSRRHFLQIMGASLALAGLGTIGCRRPTSSIVPYSKSPEWLIPGKTVEYVTSMPRLGGALSVLTTCVDGRPIKTDINRYDIEGPQGSDVFLQASLLDLYDPDRARFFKKRSSKQETSVAVEPQGDLAKQDRPLSWGKIVEPDAFYATLKKTREKYLKNQGKGLAFLFESSTSPTRDRLRKEIAKKMPQAIWAEYEPLFGENELKATEAVVGEPCHIRYDYEKADVLLAIDCDFIGTDGSPSAVKGYAAGRRRADSREKNEKMSRLYAVESRFSLTGGNADHRLRLPSSQMGLFVKMLAAELAQLLPGQQGEKLRRLPAFQKLAGASQDWIPPLAQDLVANRGRALICVGSQQPASVHAMVLMLNEALSAWGETLELIPSLYPQASSLFDLAKKIDAEQVHTLFVMGGNPVYNAPVDLNWAAKQNQVEEVIRVSLHEDETTEHSHWQVPEAHYLESWGDHLDERGRYLSQQPMILPLFGGLSQLDLLGLLLGSVEFPSKKQAPASSTTVAPATTASAEAVEQQQAGQDAQPAQAQANVVAAQTETGNQAIASGLKPQADAAVPFQGSADEKLPEINSYFLVQETFKQRAGARGNGEKAWRQFLHDGSLEGSAFASRHFRLDPAKVQAFIQNDSVPLLQPDEYELTFYADPSIGDGRYNNNGWLQELPDPITKLTWDNALLVSPTTAEKLGVVTNHESTEEYNPQTHKKDLTVHGVNTPTRGKFPMVKITVEGRELDCVVLEAPGQADQSFALALGYGRRRTGHVGWGAGFNAYQLRTRKAPAFVLGVRVEKISSRYDLSLTQEHNSMEGRAQVREAPLDTYQHHPDFVQQMGIASHIPGYNEKEPGKSFPPFYNNPYDKPENQSPLQWGMSIDLNTCTGCNTCVVACQSENNIPIVGKEQVRYGREMHWIRNDRYFSGDREDPQMLIQPVACMHCENAPCETVCPVNATVHSDEGLNVMAYNRCIGTRYCANNCPYKVRRFNYFNYNERPLDELYWGPLAEKGMAETKQMAMNPNVTVRMRGVMEKCTYCVQRIEEAKIAQLRDAQDSVPLPPPDGTVRTACQEACPAGAIDFGLINDSDSVVAQQKAHPRNYEVLGYLGVRPRTSYLARVKNPNPQMPDAWKIGNTLPIHESHGHSQEKHEASTH